MKKSLKYLTIFLTLGLPVFIFLFLKKFGDNRYAIPVYHLEEPSEKPTGCLDIIYPHQVNWPKLQELNVNNGSAIKIINPVLNSCFDCPPNLNEIKRIAQRHQHIPIFNILVEGVTSFNNEGLLPDNCIIHVLTLTEMINLLQCELLIDFPLKPDIKTMKEKSRLVLLDDQNRIRGYFDEGRSEADRLITEITILELSNEE